MTNQSHAQIGHEESEKPLWYAFINGLWFDAGYGFSTLGKAAISNGSIQIGDSTLISIGASRTWGRYSNFIRATDYFAMAGYVIKKKYSVSAFQAGVSYSMMKDYSYNSNTFVLTTTDYNKLGIAVQGKFYWCPAKAIGLGLNIFADVNPNQTHGALLFSIAIGKLNYLY